MGKLRKVLLIFQLFMAMWTVAQLQSMVISKESATAVMVKLFIAAFWIFLAVEDIVGKGK